MIKIAILATTLYLTPIIKDKGYFGLKYTQRITNSIYFKIRYQDINIATEERDPKVKAYLEFDF